MIDFFLTESGQAVAISGTLTVIGAMVRHWLNGKVKLIAFSPNSSFFQFAPPGPDVPALNIRSSQVIVQNLGRLPAENVEIISEATGNPAGYNITPVVDFKVGATASGRWMVKIPYIAPKEVVTLQILNGANIEQVRCKGGVAKFVPVTHQRIYPFWANVAASILIVVGVFSLLYWIVAELI